MSGTRPAANEIPLAERVVPVLIIAAALAADLIVDPPFGVAILVLLIAYVVAVAAVRVMRARRGA